MIDYCTFGVWLLILSAFQIQKYLLFNTCTHVYVSSILSCILDIQFSDNIDPTGTLRNWSSHELKYLYTTKTIKQINTYIHCLPYQPLQAPFSTRWYVVAVSPCLLPIYNCFFMLKEGLRIFIRTSLPVPKWLFGILKDDLYRNKSTVTSV